MKYKECMAERKTGQEDSKKQKASTRKEIENSNTFSKRGE